MSKGFGHKTSNPLQKEERLGVVTRLMRRGYTQDRIVIELRKLAEASGMGHLAVSQQQVSKDVAVVRQRMLAEDVEDARILRAELKAQYRQIREEMWDAYDRSHGDEETVTEEYGARKQKDGDGDDGDGPGASGNGRRKGAGRQQGKGPGRAAPAPVARPGDFNESLIRLKEIRKRVGRLPRDAYIAKIMETLKAEREMYGTDAAQKLDVNSTVTMFDWNRFLDQLSTGDVAVPTDPLLARLERDVAAEEQQPPPEAAPHPAPPEDAPKPWEV